MKSSPNSGSWGTLVVMMGLPVICFSGQLSGPVLVAAEHSKSLLSLASMLSANFSNEEQVQRAIDNGEPPLYLVVDTFYPVRMNVFLPNITFYFEESIDGDFFYRDISVLEEDDQGLIYVKAYKLTVPAPYGTSTPTFDLSLIENLTLDDLEYHKGCDATLYQINEDYFFGKWPECEYAAPEDNIYYPSAISCGVSAFIDPFVDTQNGRQVPDLFVPNKRFPLLPYAYGGAANKDFCEKV